MSVFFCVKQKTAYEMRISDWSSDVRSSDLEVRHGSDAGQGAPRAHGPHRPGQSGRPYLVPQVAALAHRPDAGHDPARHRADPVLRRSEERRVGTEWVSTRSSRGSPYP